MESNVEHEGVHFTAPMKEPWDEYEMGGAADREEFRDSLHNTQHYCFKQKSKRASFALKSVLCYLYCNSCLLKYR